VLQPGPLAAGVSVASSLALSLAPEEEPSLPPAWLYPEQQQSFRRVAAAVRRYRGALLADPVGSGKTFVALAVAALFNGSAPTTCFAPAMILFQWKSAAASLGVPVLLCSHEQVSRGRLPPPVRGMVIIDESHHYRNHGTRRYGHLAPWLLGCRTLLVTATPIVNRALDLAHQLHLAVRDDVLVAYGVASLKTLLRGGGTHPALGRLVFEGEMANHLRPRRVVKSSTSTSEWRWMDRSVAMLSDLRLSENKSIASLVRTVLFRAAASSPAAVAGTLRRYRRLLLHARDARDAGQFLGRAELRRFTAELGDQLMLWQLLPATDASSELVLTDLAEIDKILETIDRASPVNDPKLERLRQSLLDMKPSLVFVCSRDTVRYLRNALAELRVAWCTGERAGIGHVRLPRATVLGWFQPGNHGDPPARHLVVTDVAAEGLDLQRAARVVHYDLPWNPMRLEQRVGRAVRLGSRHAEVEVVRFAPAPILERALHLEATLARKGKLPASSGLGHGGRSVWRWMGELAQRFGGIRAVAGLAAVSSGSPGLLAGFTLHHSMGPGAFISSNIVWLTTVGALSEDPELIGSLLARAGEQKDVTPVEHQKLWPYLTLLSLAIRSRLRAAEARKWVMGEPAPATQVISRRLYGLIHLAAKDRDSGRLEQLEKVLAVITGGHTAGEEILMERLAQVSDGDLVRQLGMWPGKRLQWGGIEARLNGLVLFD
jgi:hypothetical protein